MNIALIGMSGVGKSAVGKELAKRLNYRFIDVDRLIEKSKKMKLQKILDKMGDENFLKIEEKALLDIGETDNSVISPGGSIIYSKEAMKFLKGNSKIIFLSSSLEDIRHRTLNFSLRGVVGLKERGLRKLFDERQCLYERYADVKIEMPKKFDLDMIVKDIIEKTKK